MEDPDGCPSQRGLSDYLLAVKNHPGVPVLVNTQGSENRNCDRSSPEAQTIFIWLENEFKKIVARMQFLRMAGDRGIPQGEVEPSVSSAERDSYVGFFSLILPILLKESPLQKEVTTHFVYSQNSKVTYLEH